MIRHLLLMSNLISCPEDCFGRGECNNGTCLCEIRFAGEYCDGPNLPYHAGIGGVFLLVALVCAIQLMMCIAFEYQRLKAPNLLRACRITTQKLLYFVMFLASLIRGAYFLSPNELKDGWSNLLLTSYYPFLLSGSSLIVCLWAEVFHLQDIRWERAQFLSKSFLAFLTFNIITYGLLFAEILTTQFASRPSHDQSFYMHIFNGCYAVLLFIVVVFFLVYGVEVYFKVRGAFIIQPVKLSGSGPESEPLNAADQQPILRPKINNSQLHQSRVGLISQAFMLIIIVGFLFSETLSEFWKAKVPVVSRNWHDIVFRIVEIGVAIWFPAVLWNCMSPDELWILNPRKLLAKLDNNNGGTTVVYLSSGDGETPSKIDGEAFEKTAGVGGDCWICYDMEKNEPLIKPCACTGDVSSVHHECLRRWLMESSSTSAETALRCKVCNCPYNVQMTSKLDWERGFTAQHWGSTALFVTCLSLAVAGAWIVIQIFDDSYIRMISASIALLIIYVCIRFLGQNTVNAYQRAKIGSVNISNHVTTISGNVTVTTSN